MSFSPFLSSIGSSSITSRPVPAGPSSSVTNIKPTYKNYNEYATISNELNNKLKSDYEVAQKDKQLSMLNYENNSDQYFRKLDTACDELKDANGFNFSLNNSISFLKKLGSIYRDGTILNREDYLLFLCSLRKFFTVTSMQDLDPRKMSRDIVRFDDLITPLFNPEKVNRILNDYFLSKTIYNKTTIKYLAKGANGRVDEIIITDESGNAVKMIEKMTLDSSIEDIVRECIVGMSLLMSVRDRLPNFTITYGIFHSFRSVELKDFMLEMNTDNIDQYDVNPADLIEILNEHNNTYKYQADNTSRIKRPMDCVGNIDRSSNSVFLLTDYSSGITLEQLLKRMIINEKMLLDLLIQLLRAVCYANQKIGFCHNDLHYGNVIISTLPSSVIINEVFPVGYNCHKTSNIVKLIDYGMSTVNGYPIYWSSLFLNQNNHIHNDIFKIMTYTYSELFVIVNRLSMSSSPDMNKFINCLAIIAYMLYSYYFDDIRQMSETKSFDEFIVDFRADSKLRMSLYNIINYSFDPRSGCNGNPESVKFNQIINSVLKNKCTKDGQKLEYDNPSVIYKHFIDQYNKIINSSIIDLKTDPILFNECEVQYYRGINPIVETILQFDDQGLNIEIKEEQIRDLFKKVELIEKLFTNINKVPYKFDNGNKDLLIASINSFVDIVRTYIVLCINNNIEINPEFLQKCKDLKSLILVTVGIIHILDHSPSSRSLVENLLN